MLEIKVDKNNRDIINKVILGLFTSQNFYMFTKVVEKFSTKSVFKLFRFFLTIFC